MLRQSPVLLATTAAAGVLATAAAGVLATTAAAGCALNRAVSLSTSNLMLWGSCKQLMNKVNFRASWGVGRAFQLLRLSKFWIASCNDMKVSTNFFDATLNLPF
jgi:hypothetical protein